MKRKKKTKLENETFRLDLKGAGLNIYKILLEVTGKFKQEHQSPLQVPFVVAHLKK